MAMVIKNNMAATRTLNILNSNSSALQKSSTKVASGMKITGAQDDAAGYAISERMRVRIRALDQANQNSQNDSSLMKTAEGAVGNTIDILKALKEKCINAANDSNTDEDRRTIQKEVDQYIDQIDDNAQVTFNGKSLIDGTKNNAAVATKTILLNQSLKEGTLAADKLTSLNNRAGDSLGIQSTDYYQVSWVENGKIHTTSGQVGNNSIASILATPDANGDTLQATVAATSKNGLIGTTEPSSGYGETSMKVYNSTNLTKDEVEEMFSGIEDFANQLAQVTSNTKALTIKGYYTAPVDDSGEFKETPASQTITVTYKTDTSSTGYHYEVGGVKCGKDSSNNDIFVNDKNSAVTLYTKTVPSSTYVDKNGDSVTANGYLDAPVLCGGGTDTTPVASNSITSAGTFTAGNLPAEITANASLTANSEMSLANEGFYYATGYDDNGKPTGYAIASGTITLSGTTYTVSSDATVGKVLYKLDTGGTGVSDAKIELSNTQTSKSYTFRDLPKTISVYPDEGTVDKYNKDVYTPDGTYGVAVVANKAGVDNQISGLTISILDQDLNVKKSANASLDQFKLYQRAENKTGDQALNFHLGSEANQAIKVGFTDMRSQALGLKGADGTRINVYTKENANASINVIESAITRALDQQTTIGAVESRLEYTSANLTTASENVQASESTIRDADMAKEMTTYTKNNILLQAAQAMLAQANQSSSSVLSLLQ